VNTTAVLFVCYQRFELIKKNLVSFSDANDIYIFIDGPKSRAVQCLQEEFIANNPSLNIYQGRANLGVRRFIPFAISHVLKTHDRVIIIEDDILVSSSSMEFVNKALNLDRVSMVSLFSPLVRKESFLSINGGIWGWAVKKEAWSNFVMKKETFSIIFRSFYTKLGLSQAVYFTPLVWMSQRDRINSWAYQWFYIRVKHNIITAVPSRSLAQNFGISDIRATNTNRSHPFSKITAATNAAYAFLEEEYKISLLEMTGYSSCTLMMRTLYNYLRCLK